MYLSCYLDFLANTNHNAFIVNKISGNSNVNFYGALNGSNSSNSLHAGLSNNLNYRLNYWGNDWAAAISANYKQNSINIINYQWVANTSKSVYTNGGFEGQTLSGVGNIGIMNGGGVIGNAAVINTTNTFSNLNGSIYEVIMYPSVLTTQQRQQVEGYLAWKWNIQSSLPNTHPYYTNPFIQNLPVPQTPSTWTLTNYVFSPKIISGLALWLDAADQSTIVRTNTSVTQWNDKSGNNRYAYASAAINNPTYTGNSIYFPPFQSGVTDAQLIFNNYINDNASIDMFLVSKPFNTSQTGTFRTLIKGLNLGTHVILLNSGTTQLGTYYGGLIQYGSLTIDGSARCLLYVSINASYQFTASINGSLTLSAPTSATAKEDRKSVV